MTIFQHYVTFHSVFFCHFCCTYLLRKPGRHEWHLERIRIGVQCVKGVRRHGAQHRVDSARELIADCAGYTNKYFLVSHSVFEGEMRKENNGKMGNSHATWQQLQLEKEAAFLVSFCGKHTVKKNCFLKTHFLVKTSQFYVKNMSI